jgi:hypothetical protein
VCSTVRREYTQRPGHFILFLKARGGHIGSFAEGIKRFLLFVVPRDDARAHIGLEKVQQEINETIMATPQTKN